MTNPDHFIDEVTEELRRDRQFALMRKYGWIAILLVILIVGGAGLNEWLKAREIARAQALGDALTQALAIEDAQARKAAFAAIEADGDARAVVSLLAVGADAATPEALAAIGADPDISQIYRDLANLKLTMVGDLGPDERLALLQPMVQAGGPFRPLAEEQIALAEIEKGETEAAIARLRALLSDNDASAPLRQRATQLIVALGAAPEAS